MIHLIEGGFFADGTGLIKKKIAELTTAKKPSFLIVPEQQTLSAERMMCDVLPESAPLCFEVTNFTRLADTAFRTVGGIAGSYADERAKALIMWRTLTELSGSLNGAFGSSVNSGGVQRVLSAVKEMQSLSISPKMLSDAEDMLAKSNSRGTKRLSSKLSDLSKIMTLYKKLLSENFKESEDDLMELSKLIDEHKESLFPNAEFFIDGFTSFTEPQYKVIEKLAKYFNITVNLTIPKSSPEAFEYSESAECHRRLVLAANLASTEISLKRIDGIGDTNPLISEICSLVFRTNQKVSEEFLKNPENLGIF